MPIMMPGKKWIGYGAIAVLLGLSIGAWAYWRFKTEQQIRTIPMATFSLGETMKVLPQWDRYEQLTQEIAVLQTTLRSLGLVTQDIMGEGAETSSSQSSPKHFYFPSQEPTQVSSGMISLALTRQQEGAIAKVQNLMQGKAEQLQKEIEATLTQKKSEYDRDLQDYQRGVELEYSLKISELEAKLKDPSLNDFEKNALNAEVFSVREQMSSLISAKEQAYAGEIKTALSRLQQEAGKTMQEYQKKLKAEFERQMKQKAQQVQLEALKLNSLLAERETLRLEMLSQIRREIKTAAENNQLDLVIANPTTGINSPNFILAFPKGKDLTDELTNLLR